MNSKETALYLNLAFDGELNYQIGSCPICERRFEVDYEEHYKYCPDCGQKLDWSRYNILKISDDEKVILKNLPKEYKYISKGYYGDLEIYTDNHDYLEMPMFNHLFKFIPKDTKRGYSIEDLLNLKEE